MPNWRKVHFLTVEERRQKFRNKEVLKGLRYDLVEDPVPRAFSKRWDLMYVNEVKLYCPREGIAVLETGRWSSDKG